MLEIIIGTAMIGWGVYTIIKHKLYKYFYWTRRRSEEIHERMINTRLFTGSILVIVIGIATVLIGLGFKWW